MVELCPHCGASVLFFDDKCPNCQKSSIQSERSSYTRRLKTSTQASHQTGTALAALPPSAQATVSGSTGPNRNAIAVVVGILGTAMAIFFTSSGSNLPGAAAVAVTYVAFHVVTRLILSFIPFASTLK